MKTLPFIGLIVLLVYTGPVSAQAFVDYRKKVDQLEATVQVLANTQKKELSSLRREMQKTGQGASTAENLEGQLTEVHTRVDALQESVEEVKGASSEERLQPVLSRLTRMEETLETIHAALVKTEEASGTTEEKTAAGGIDASQLAMNQEDDMGSPPALPGDSPKINKPIMKSLSLNDGFTSEAIELGQAVAVDIGVPAGSDEEGSFGVGTAELSVAINVREGMQAFAVLAATENLEGIVFDQAGMSAASGKYQVVFGQQTLPHGILSTHVISDPLMLEMVERVEPAIYVERSLGDLAAGVSLTGGADGGFGGVVNLGYSFGDESTVSLSTYAVSGHADVDLGLEWVLGDAIVNAEADVQYLVSGDADRAAGYMAGLAYALNSSLTGAVRFDGIAAKGSIPELRYAAGLSYTFDNNIFVATETGYVGPAGEEGALEILFQVGLESNLNLPGYQRRTLTNQ